MLVGTDSDAIAATVHLLLDDTNTRAAFTRNVNPYGDGRASARIVAALAGRPLEEFKPVMLRATKNVTRVVGEAFA